MAKFVAIGERLSTTAPIINKAFTERDPEPILKRAEQQLKAGATYLDVNIGPAESDGEDLMKWAVELLQAILQRSACVGYLQQESNRGWYFRIQPCKGKADRKLCRRCRTY